MTSSLKQHAATQQPTRPSNLTTTPHDDLDDLFNYDVDLGDVFGEVDTNMDVPVKKTSSSKAGAKENSTNLGIDEEIKITKKRRPVVKLDEERLLSQAGIPKLRRLAKERLKFKGKGHEYSDVARLLSFYQLWLDDLYPRAKFADGLAIIEKVGHGKRMQTMRREWIDEGKPKDRFTHNLADSGQLARPQQSELQRQAFDSEGNSAERPNIDQALASSFTSTFQDEEADLANPQSLRGITKEVKHDVKGEVSLFVSDDEGEQQPPEDDLDALLAEDAQKDFAGAMDRNGTEVVKQAIATDDFDDEMEVMAGMEDMW